MVALTSEARPIIGVFESRRPVTALERPGNQLKVRGLSGDCADTAGRRAHVQRVWLTVSHDQGISADHAAGADRNAGKDCAVRAYPRTPPNSYLASRTQTRSLFGSANLVSCCHEADKITHADSVFNRDPVRVEETPTVDQYSVADLHSPSSENNSRPNA